MSAGQEWISYEPRRPVPWGGRGILVILLVLFALSQLVGAAIYLVSPELIQPPAAETAEQPVSEAKGDKGDSADHVETVEQKREKADRNFAGLILSCVITSLTCAIALAVLSQYGANRDDLGVAISRLPYDSWLGVRGFLMTCIPVLVIHFLLGLLVEPHHAVNDVLSFDFSPARLVLTATAAIVVAPLTEEFFFRVILQGWLEKLFARRRLRYAPVAGYTTPWPAPSPEYPPAEDAVAQQAAAPKEFAEEYSANESVTPTIDVITPEVVHADDEPELTAADMRPQLLPLLISSLLFAAVHYGNGPSPVPLFFFALMLGYLYRQTHRLWPSVVAHACLNALSTIVLATGGGQ